MLSGLSGLSGLSAVCGGAAPTLAERVIAVVGTAASFWLPGPSYWFTDAGKTTPCGDTDLIRVWADASANGRDLLQATSGNRPMADLTSGVWGAVFDGVDDFLAVASYSQSTAPVSMAAAYKLSASGNYPMLMNCRSTIRELWAGAGDTRHPLWMTDGGTAGVLDTIALTLGVVYRLVGTSGNEGGAAFIYRDGAARNTDPVDTTSVYTPPNTIQMSGRAGASYVLPGTIYFGLFTPEELTAQQVADLDAIISTLGV